LIEEARILLDAGHPDIALEKAMRVYQMPEEDEPTLDAVELLLDLRALDSPAAAFATQRLSRRGDRLAEAYDRPESREGFAEVYDTAWEYLEEHFVGATYLDTDSHHDVLVLDVREWVDRGEAEPHWVASIQYGYGELAQEDARAIASNETYERVESGDSRSPLEEACEERAHEFPIKDLRETPLLAICSRCDLSRDTIEQLLGQEVPSVCDDCESVSYETELVDGPVDESADVDVLCADCAA
jgi:hypothetical protein